MDMIDGIIARKLGTEGEFGTNSGETVCIRSYCSK